MGKFPIPVTLTIKISSLTALAVSRNGNSSIPIISVAKSIGAFRGDGQPIRLLLRFKSFLSIDIAVVSILHSIVLITEIILITKLKTGHRKIIKRHVPLHSIKLHLNPYFRINNLVD